MILIVIVCEIHISAINFDIWFFLATLISMYNPTREGLYLKKKKRKVGVMLKRTDFCIFVLCMCVLTYLRSASAVMTQV